MLDHASMIRTNILFGELEKFAKHGSENRIYEFGKIILGAKYGNGINFIAYIYIVSLQ